MLTPICHPLISGAIQQAAAEDLAGLSVVHLELASDLLEGEAEPASVEIAGGTVTVRIGQDLHTFQHVPGTDFELARYLVESETPERQAA